MAFSDSHRQALAQLKDREASLHKELSRYQTEEAKASEDYRRHIEYASRASSSSSVKSYLGNAERAQKKVAEVSRKIADVLRKLAQNSKDQANKTRNLQQAEKSERQAEERNAEQRRRKEKDHAREIARLSSAEVRHIYIHAPKPEQLRVLYLTANSNLDLRTEREIRQVQQALKSAKYRERVDVQQRPAATFQDLVDGLNDVRPHVVHFSGHGGGAALVFEGGDIQKNTTDTVNFSLLASALAATDNPPVLLVLNACDTLSEAASAFSNIKVVVAMADAIDDVAAVVFARQFYAAIASGQSVKHALDQARVMVKAALLDDEASDMIQHVAQADVDLGAVILVTPE